MITIEELMKMQPGRNVVFIALDKLADDKSIRQFVKDYIDYMEDNGFRQYTALSNISYVLNYYGNVTRQSWDPVLREFS
jgi:hypothetical protein